MKFFFVQAVYANQIKDKPKFVKFFHRHVWLNKGKKNQFFIYNNDYMLVIDQKNYQLPFYLH